MSDTEIVQRVACKGVVIRDNKVLLLRESGTYEEGTKAGRYQFPGGRINPGEPFLEALKREMLEETGMIVQIGDPIYIGEWYPTIRGVKNHIVGMFFLCAADAQDVVLSEEHDQFVWVSAEESLKLDIVPPDRDVIAKALA